MDKSHRCDYHCREEKHPGYFLSARLFTFIEAVKNSLKLQTVCYDWGYLGFLITCKLLTAAKLSK